MFKFITILASLIGVAAFAPAARTSTRSALKMSFEDEPGVLRPTGFWDPVGLSNGISQERFDQYRTAELKHGRVCMLGVLGYIVPEVFRFPGDIAPGLSFKDIPSGLAAIEGVPNLGWFQIIFLIGAVDYWGFKVLIPGDTEGAGKTPEQLKTAQTQELQNGRLAMLAMLELLRHDAQMSVGGMYPGDHLITGLPFLYN